ncbi:iron-containing alcohol dehydrogenase family protein [Streptococcus plurextorum]|uniref:iron-containing alcohol dehydrogenase family protein n=1 Tax=Streptococcus plurextorum TaxID=456876 RepID=UPI0004122DED|nr:iron-containing alcohol dehydrogenase family protein [Streptococcus plurextorum]
MATQYLSNYSYGDDCFAQLPLLLKKYGAKSVVLLGGKTALSVAEGAVRDSFKDSDIKITGVFIYGKAATQANIDRLVALTEVQSADVILAFGGGQALDICKMVAHLLEKTLITVPTIASTCAAGTAIAIIYKEDHSLDYYGFPKAASHMLIPTNIIAQAPSKYLWAGIGDGISKGPEVERATKEALKRGVTLPHAAQLGLAVAKSSLPPFYQHGLKAMQDTQNGQSSSAIEEIVLAIIVSTGYASNLVNQEHFDYTACHAHAFYNGTTAIAREGEYLHGSIVAFGVMVLHAYFKEMAELEQVARFNKCLELPTTLADIGLTKSDIPVIVAKALTTNECKNTPFDENRFAEAILEADEFGRNIE